MYLEDSLNRVCIYVYNEEYGEAYSPLDNCGAGIVFLLNIPLQEVEHNMHGPALIDSKGELEYYQYGRRHNLNGPAILGGKMRYTYWLDNTSYSKEEWENELSIWKEGRNDT